MALKNRRTQNKKSNKKRQQSKRGGTRKSVKKNRITIKRGGASVEERITTLEGKITTLEGKMRRYDDDINSSFAHATRLYKEIDTLKENMPISIGRGTSGYN